MENEHANFSGDSAQNTVLALREAQAWIEAVTGKKFSASFRQSLENGVLLCEFMELLRHGSITKINRRSSPIAHLDNIKQFLSACESCFGLRGGQLFEITDLQDPSSRKGSSIGGVRRREADRRIRNVCVALYWLGRALASKEDYAGPQLCLEAFENIMSGEDVFASDEYSESVQEVTVHMTTNNGGFGFQIVGGHDCSVPATVDRVVVGGAAGERGLQPNDVIVSLNGTAITQLSHLELIRLIKQSGAKGSIVLGLLRRGAFKEFSPPVDNAYRSSSDSPLPNHDISHINGRRESEEHVAKGELLVQTAQQPNTVYVGDSSGEDSEASAKKIERTSVTIVGNSHPKKQEHQVKKLSSREDDESERKRVKDRELCRKQQEEIAQIYPSKFSWANNHVEPSTRSSSSSSPSGAKVFDKYGGNMASPIGASVAKEKELQLQNELQHVSHATSHFRQKWHREENRAVSLSPVMQKKQQNLEHSEKKRKLSAESQGDQVLQILEDQLKQLQLEAKVAREETESLKRIKAEDETRIRREEQAKYEEELKRQNMDTKRLLSEMQQQQQELMRQQQSIKQSSGSEQEQDEIRQQLEEQRRAIADQWQVLDEERQAMEEQRQKQARPPQQQQQPEGGGRYKSDSGIHKQTEQHEQNKVVLQERYYLEEGEEPWSKQDLHNHDLSLDRAEVEQRRERERREEMQRQMERLQKKHQSPTSYNPPPPPPQQQQASHNVSPPASTISYTAVSSSYTATSVPATAAVEQMTKPIIAGTQSNSQLCARCMAPLGFERAMQVCKLGLSFHLKCFMCVVCHAPLATGLERTNVLICDSRPHCKFCYSTNTGLLTTEC